MPILEKIDGFSNQGRPVSVDMMAPPVQARPNAAGYASMMGHEPDNDIAPLYDSPADMPHDGILRMWKDADGVQRGYINGEVKFTLQKSAAAQTIAEEKGERGAKAELTSWQKRRNERAAKMSPAIKVETNGAEWYLAKPSLTQLGGLAGLQALAKYDENGKPTQMESWFAKVASGMFYVLCVNGEYDKSPFFKSVEEAVEFCDDPEFSTDAVKLFNCINEEFGDFLERL